jgi:hypothetical protein
LNFHCLALSRREPSRPKVGGSLPAASQAAASLPIMRTGMVNGL